MVLGIEVKFKKTFSKVSANTLGRMKTFIEVNILADVAMASGTCFTRMETLTEADGKKENIMDKANIGQISLLNYTLKKGKVLVVFFLFEGLFLR